MSNLKQYVVVQFPDCDPKIWLRERWLDYLSNTANPGIGRVITTFNAGEELKEGGGMSGDQAVMAFAHHMNKQRGYETVHGTMYYNDADSDKPLTAVGIAEQWIQSQTGEPVKER